MEQRSIFYQLFRSLRVAIGLAVAFPFLVILLPLWYVYRWSEVLAGRPKPDLPWAEVWPRKRQAAEPPSTRTPTESSRAAADPAQLPTGWTREPESFSMAQSPIPLPAIGGVALVTGGARHLGAAICQDLATLGYRVAVVYHHSAAEAEAVVAAIEAKGGVARAFVLDQGDPTQCIQLLQAVEQLWGVPDLLINNASLFAPTRLAEASWEGLELLNRVNLQGPMWLAMRLGERLQKRLEQGGAGGQIIQICDIWGERPLAGYTAYSVSKAGLIMATQALARELAPMVRVNGIAPGAVLPKMGEENFQKMLSHTPLARYAGPEAVLNAIRYLLTASFVTGEILHVDGGRRLL
ncbi:MAG: SDR family oxidoreductase [Magnetococcales bacterium]|nr:SDR family oxidoreductase [Magnetococcales bacterium]